MRLSQRKIGFTMNIDLFVSRVFSGHIGRLPLSIAPSQPARLKKA